MITENPSTFLNETNLYSSEEGAQAALTGVYGAMIGYHYSTRSYPIVLMMHSGKFYGDHGASKDLYQLNPLPNGKFLGKMWSDMYRMINRANDVIKNLNESNLDPSEKDPILGEVYFLRAVTYFNLVRMWGAVPLTLEPTTTETLAIPRTPVEEVYNAIISDLENAKSLMHDPSEQRTGRPNKYAAHALLAKVYVTMAGNDNSSQYWQDAYDNAITVYNEGPYDLVSSYSELWHPMKENSVESIFEIQLNREISLRMVLETMLRRYYPNTNTRERVKINKEVYDTHIQMYPEDPRMGISYADSSYIKYRNKGPKELDLYPVNNRDKRGWPGLQKWHVPGISNSKLVNINLPYLRYADHLLLLAEIENELNGPSNAYQYVNQVLARARDIDGDGVSDSPDPADWSGMTQDEFRERIMQERVFELIGEAQTWFDVRRRGYDYFLENVIRKHNNNPNNTDLDFVFPESEKNMLFPIPANEINANPAITPSDQNPGY
ncbi:RagB/SusD family nutrient uptake outer membrane protein [Balneolaceae bacterium YR4-1]|uniref:RagB/SusD family nutrient uptake outer membrane protein n=2 Tax=Halalkalibaculum roseum TaxID=2709311 RepID=A0A6M1SWM8_9BACT|nr:RagB/SusD family nutrient uptake outer membrane protein [Halalkalibaculum roseum]